MVFFLVAVIPAAWPLPGTSGCPDWPALTNTQQRESVATTKQRARGRRQQEPSLHSLSRVPGTGDTHISLPLRRGGLTGRV